MSGLLLLLWWLHPLAFRIRLLLSRWEIEPQPVSACFHAVGLACRPLLPRCSVEDHGGLLLVVELTQVFSLPVVVDLAFPLTTVLVPAHPGEVRLEGLRLRFQHYCRVLCDKAISASPAA